MKKTTAILASAVALVMAGSAIAETTVYGRARMGLIVASDNNVSGLAADKDKNGLVNDSSRFGFKGSEDLGNGMSAIYKFELGYNADNAAQASGVSTRIGMVGLKGDFGTFAMGNMWVPTYNLVRGNIDPFNHFGLDSGYGFRGRAGDALAYANNFGDVKFQAAIVASDADNVDMTDGYSVAVNFPAGPVSVGIGVDSDTNDSATAVTVGYKGDGFGVTLGYEDAEKLGGDKVTTLVGTVGVGSKGKVLLRWSDFSNAGVNGTTLGYHHALSKRTKVYAEISSGDIRNDGTIIGLRHDF